MTRFPDQTSVGTNSSPGSSLTPKTILFSSVIQVTGWTLFVLLFYFWHVRESGINLAGHFTLWLLGLLGIWFSMKGLQKSCRERDNALRELTASEGYFRSLYEDAPLAYQSLDANGHILDVNENWTRTMGYSQEEAIGRSMKDFIAPEYHDSLNNNFTKFLQEGRIHGLEYDFIRKDGSRLTMLVDGKLSRDPVRDRFRTHCILTDISQRRRAEESLRLYQQIVSATKDPMSFISTDYTVLAANQAHEELFGIPLEQIVGKPVSELVGAKLFDKSVKTELDRAFAGNLGCFELNVPLPNRKQVFLDIAFYPYVDKQQNITGVVASLNDNTYRKRMESELQHAQKMEAIGTLAGGIAHDFNNILSAIQGYTELSLLDLPKDSKTYANLTQVSHAARRAADLVRQILIFSRQTEHEKKPLIVQPVLKEAIKLLRSSLPSTVSIRQNISTDCRPVMADVAQLHQVFMNLCTNAYQALPETGGLINISMQPYTEDGSGQDAVGIKRGEYNKLTVSDNGRGIDEENIGRIFEPYFTTKELGKGTGLGLAVVHGIVKDYDGVITVKSKPGIGTTFDIYLPVIIEPVTKSVSPDLDNLEKISGHILFVDDESAIVEMTTQILKKLGCNVSSFTDSREALTAFKAEPDKYALVLTDQTMPHLTGLQIIQQMLEIRPDTPIILTTGYSETITEEAAREAGAAGYLQKPFTIGKLARAIGNIARIHGQPKTTI